MARNMYGATSADFTLTSGGRVVPGATLTIWSARTGGTQITDLLDVDSVATTTVTSDADGSIVYYGPNNDKTVHWADSGVGNRIAVRPTDITGDPPVLSIGTVGTGTAAASLTGTSEAPVLNLTLPSAGANGVNTAAIQDSAVTSAKIADGTIATGDIADGAVTYAKLGADVRIGNLLTANQASGTDTLGDTTGFTSLNACTLARSTAWAVQGAGSLAMTATSTSAMAAGTTGNTGGLAQGGVAVTVGDTVTGIVTVRAAAGVTRTVQAKVYFYTSAGTYLSNVAGQSLTSSDSADTPLRVTTTVPATAAYAGVVVSVGTGTGGDVIYADGFSVHRGASGQWAMPGTPIVGQSHIATNGAVHLSGTGSPEGVVTAAPGSTWLQTDATTDVKGWIRWVKATGTGNTGWVAGPEADTGWRDVTVNATTAALTKYPNLKLAVRRIGHTVDWIVYTGTGATDGAAVTSLAETTTTFKGFLSDVQFTYRSAVGAMILSGSGQPNVNLGLYMGSGSLPVLGQGAVAGAGTSSQGSLTYSAGRNAFNTWPTALPGSAA